ncbi:MAG: hypothetical protein GF383_14800 [Candidatus Lokiarchaeota archaeon]|nr:hypothetical protein [Candidatus Lokiarchaeota archaeon]MBD3342685.1 hypothetical protein [Candidatus Lokiarchaeota archaeon]
MTENSKDQDEHELKKIRMKKMQALMEAQKRKQQNQENQSNVYDKINYVLSAVLSPDAYEYLNNLKSTEPQIYQRIYNELITPEVVQNIDYLLAMISQRGGVARRIPRDVIVYLERQIKGIKSSIKVQRDDKMMDLGSFLSKK